ncbi:serine aminopeptidase domain-containing protein [Variovorax rhizosphaerae]|uniref:Alpha/beta hydrolase n=1 Tax=Variovorax rhizosphaerae TaxID=1836200 RepID=A0ABU8WGT1_9BURK
MRMTPLMFGPSSRQLFGLFHPAQRVGGTAVLICPPFGQEAIRAHRLVRVLADRLARSGVSVLRFDYYGSGDSPGDESEAELEGWRRDVCVAHEELVRLTDAPNVVWLGARLGAAVAVMAARSGRCDPARLLLWDPIVDGKAYLTELRERHVDALERSFVVPKSEWRRQLAQPPETFTGELLGFEVSPLLHGQLGALDAASLRLTALYQTTILASEDDVATRHWAEGELARHMPLRLLPFKHPMEWISDPHPHNAMVPAEAVQRLLAEVGK